MIETFKKNHIKITEQRKKIYEVIDLLKDNATLKNIENKTKGLLDTSTIYRTLDFFLEKGIIEKSLNYKGEVIYSIFSTHQHYFYCVKCHTREKIKNCPIKQIENDFKKEGNHILLHSLKLEGICKNCINQ